jgi:hypothetical protein
MKRSTFSKLFTRRVLIGGTLVLASALGMPAMAAAQNRARTFTVSNESSYRINEAYVSPSGDRFWHDDKLGRHVVPPDYHFSLTVVPGWYDVKLVDEDGDQCVVNNVDLRDGQSWTITNDLLLACESFSAH